MMSALATPENVAALDRAAELISDPEKWCQGFSARDGHARECFPDSPRAERWCAAGALWKYEVYDASLALIADRRAECLYGRHLPAVNDELGRIPAKHVIEALAAELRSKLP